MFTDDSANNNSKLIFRLRFSGNNTGTKGNNRFDNVTVDADTLGSTSAVATINPNNLQYVLYPNPVTNQINIATASEEGKTIAIYNAMGQTVFMGMQNGKNITLSTGTLSAGNYYIVVRGNNSGNTQTLKFVKE
jgi:hypothetical protein